MRKIGNAKKVSVSIPETVLKEAEKKVQESPNLKTFSDYIQRLVLYDLRHGVIKKEALAA